MMPKLSAWDTHNGYLADKRKAGATLEEIGKEVGITRERVRQILIAHYGTTKMTPFLAARQLGQLANLTENTIAGYRRRGIIKPVNSSSRRPLYGLDALKAILAYRQCRVCGKPLLGRKWFYCSPECYKVGNNKARKRSQWRMLRRKKRQPITPSIAYERRGYG